MLARTNFARMFKMIPAIEQQIFKSNPNMMVRAVSQAGGGLTMTEKIYPFGFKKGGAGNRRTVEVDLTREDWAMGVTQGHDMLTKEWWDKVGNDMLDPEHSGDELSKSLGSHGDKVDQDRYYEQAILEFRKMKQDMTPAQFKTEMIKNWDFLRGVMQAPWEE